MKASEVRGMGLHEAEEKLLEFKTSLAKERAVRASGTRPENPGKIRALRREIARFLTIIGEKKKSGTTGKTIEAKKEEKKHSEKEEMHKEKEQKHMAEEEKEKHKKDSEKPVQKEKGIFKKKNVEEKNKKDSKKR